MSRVSEEYYLIKKAAIVDAAIEVCKRKTVLSATMQDVIDEANLSQGGIYRYYSNIDDVLIGVLSKIRIDQYSSIDRLENVFHEREEKIKLLRSKPSSTETIVRRRKLIADLIKEIHVVWASEITKFLYPHKKLEMEFTILADSFPDRARRIFPNAAPARIIDETIIMELEREIKDGVIKPIISLPEFMEYNASVYQGIINRAISVNCYQRNANFDDSNKYDITSRYETFAKSSANFLGLGEYF